MRILSFLLHNIQSRWTRILLIGGILLGSTCFAGTENSDAVEMILQVMEIIFALISALLTPAVILAGWLLSPDWTMGDFFGLRKYFINVWVLVSNLVYIAFALILLFMAVMQIFGGESSEYTFKKKLPQFLAGILMVPFTWLIVSWTLSFANQATAAVLAIPMGAIAQMQSGTAGKDNGMFHEKVIPTKISVFLTDGGQNASTEVDCTTSATACISAAEFIANNGSGPYFIMMIYAYDIFKVQRTDLVRLKDAKCDKDANVQKCIKNLTDIVIKFGTALIVTFFFGVLTIALCWVLLMRAFKLWIYVMFSPLFGLALFSGNGFKEAFHSEGGGGGGDSGLSQVGFFQFFKLAMVPVMVSAVLAFGLLFVGVISQTFMVTNMNSSGSIGGTMCTEGSGYMVRYCIIPNGNTSEGNQGYDSQLIIGSPKTGMSTSGYTPIVFEFGDMFSGFVGNSASSSVIAGANGVVDSVESVFAHIILTLIALVIIWMGVKSAVSYDKITEKAFAPFAELGKSVGNFVQNIPSYIPTPHPAFAAASAIANPTAIAKLINKNVSDHVERHESSLAEILGNPAAREFIGKIDAAGNNPEEIARAIREAPISATIGPNALEKLGDKLADSLDSAASKATGAQKASIERLAANISSAGGDKAKLNTILNDKNNQETIKLAKEKSPGSAGVIDAATEKIGASSAGSSGSGASSEFSGHTIEDSAVKKKNGDTVDSNSDLTTAQKQDVKRVFPSLETIGNLETDTIKLKLRSIGFTDSQLAKITNTTQARAIARSLAQASDVS